jgi:hypothetical protein
MAIFQMLFSVQGTGGSPTGRDLENRVRDQDTGSPGRSASCGLQVQSESGCRRARSRSLGELSPAFILKNVIQFHQQRLVILRIDIYALWKINNAEDASRSQKIETKHFPADFCTWKFWGSLSRYAATTLIVALSPGHSDITRFRPWSPTAAGNHLDRAKRKNSKVAQTTGTFDVFYSLCTDKFCHI